MIEKEFFKRTINTDITVASLGINRDDWFCHKPGMLSSEVYETMIKNGYDIAPVIKKNGVLGGYYLRGVDNKFSNEKIKVIDKLYYLTHVVDAIWKMNKEKRTHYFLSNGKDENDIVGLLSLSNFNCRVFYIYLFDLIAYVEKQFASLIESDFQEAFIILAARSNNDALKGQLAQIKERYDNDKSNDTENDYREYLYLHHLIWLISKEGKFKKLKYEKEAQFECHVAKIKSIRNNVAHPVKSLVRNFEDLKDLHTGLTKLYEFKGRVEYYLSTTEIT